MRKIIGFLLMGVVIGGFILIMSRRFAGQEVLIGSSQQKEISQDKKILEIEQEIQANYPAKPESMIEIHNELMKIFYSADLGEEGIADYARTVRMLYASDFLALNPLENQITDLKRERETIASLKLELITSDVKEIYFLKDEKGNESEAEVIVRHTTNQGSINRIYHLMQEDGQWKIKTWENQKENADSN